LPDDLPVGLQRDAAEDNHIRLVLFNSGGNLGDGAIPLRAKTANGGNGARA
jgi:hypothetical protein